MSSDEESNNTEKQRLVIAEYDAWIEDTDDLFDTTHEELAKEKDIYDEKKVYEPLPLMTGKGRLFKGLEDSMFKAEVDKEYEVILKPEDAAGPRDPKMVELFPIREFLKQDIDPQVGLIVTVKNRTGYISAVTAGRVRVDFNNRLAGRNLKYKYKIVSEPKTQQEIFEALLKMDYGSSEGFTAEFEDKKAIIKLPDVCKYDQRWLISKYGVVNDLRDLLNLDVIQFIEEYEKSEKTEDEEVEQEKELPETQTDETSHEPKEDEHSEDNNLNE